MPEIKVIPSHRAVIVDSEDMKRIKEVIDKIREWIREEDILEIHPDESETSMLRRLIEVIDNELSKIELPED